MSQFNYLQAIYQSFYSKEFYRDVVSNWGAGVALYLLFLLAICWAATMVKMQPIVSRAMVGISTHIVAQAPDMTIKDGAVETPENRPYFIRDPDNKEEIIAIIDTSGRYTKLESDSKYMLLTKHEFSAVDNQGVMKIYTLPKSLTINIKPKIIEEQTAKVASWAWVILFPVLLLFSFLYRILQAFFYAIIGKILALIGGVRLSYLNISKLAMVAITPAILIGTVLDLFELNFPKAFLFYFILSLGYLVYAMWANKKSI